LNLTGVPWKRVQMPSKPLYLKWQTQTSNIIYIMRNGISVHLAVRGLRLALAQALDRLLLPLSDTQQGRDCSMTEMDTHDRINLTGPWAGFGFQAGHMFTPEGYSLEPVDMTWWSLTCNIAREWRLMMEEARPRPTRSMTAGRPCATTDSSVVYLREYVRNRRERRLGMGDPGPAAEVSNVVHMSRGPRRPKRG